MISQTVREERRWGLTAVDVERDIHRVSTPRIMKTRLMCTCMMRSLAVLRQRLVHPAPSDPTFFIHAWRMRGMTVNVAEESAWTCAAAWGSVV